MSLSPVPSYLSAYLSSSLYDACQQYWNQPVDNRSAKLLVCIPLISHLFVMYKQQQLEKEFWAIASQVSAEQRKAFKEIHVFPFRYLDHERTANPNLHTYMIKWRNLYRLSYVSTIGFIIQILVLPRILLSSSEKLHPGLSCLIDMASLAYCYQSYQLTRRFKVLAKQLNF